MSPTVTSVSLRAEVMEQALITQLNLRKPEKNAASSNVVLTSSRRVYLKSAIKLLVNV